MLPYGRYIYVRGEVEHSRLLLSRFAELSVVKVFQHLNLATMSLRCTACSDKSYDKAWKLQRHVRESKKCFERINPGMPANYFVRFQCFSCGYASPREPDLDRHRRRVHGETDNPIASGLHSTSSADASTEDDINVISDLSQPENPHDLLLDANCRNLRKFASSYTDVARF